jgi:hypothetical protein
MKELIGKLNGEALYAVGFGRFGVEVQVNGKAVSLAKLSKFIQPEQLELSEEGLIFIAERENADR